jgi:toxin ParE1/3/4
MSARRLRIVYTDDAKAELRDIALYTERQWGKEQSATYLRLVRSAVRTLAASPHLGRARDEIQPGLRSYPVGSHVIYYWIDDGAVNVAHVFHNRRDTLREPWPQSPTSIELLPGST